MNHKLTVASSINFCASTFFLLWIIKKKTLELWRFSSGFKWFVKISSVSEVDSSEAHRQLRKLYCYLVASVFIKKL